MRPRVLSSSSQSFSSLLQYMHAQSLGFTQSTFTPSEKGSRHTRQAYEANSMVRLENEAMVFHLAFVGRRAYAGFELAIKANDKELGLCFEEQIEARVCAHVRKSAGKQAPKKKHPPSQTHAKYRSVGSGAGRGCAFQAPKIF